MSKEGLAKDAAEIFRLLRAFRSIKDRTVRLDVVEVVEAMARNPIPADVKTGIKRPD